MVSPKGVSDAIRYVGVLVGWEERHNRDEAVAYRCYTLKAWLYFCPLFHCKCNFVRDVGLLKCVHTPRQPARCAGLQAPQFLGLTPSPHGFKEWKSTGHVASGSAYLMEGIWSRLERYFNFTFIHLENILEYLQTYVVCTKYWI